MSHSPSAFFRHTNARTHTHLYGSNRIVPESTTTKSTTTELRNGRGNEEKETVYFYVNRTAAKLVYGILIISWTGAMVSLVVLVVVE